MNEFSSKITYSDPKFGFGSGSHVQLTKCGNHVYIKNCPNIPKLRLNKNNATYERIWIRFWSVFGPFLGGAICIINDILSNKTTKCLIQTISVMFNRTDSNWKFKNPKFGISIWNNPKWAQNVHLRNMKSVGLPNIVKKNVYLILKMTHFDGIIQLCLNNGFSYKND